MGATDDTPKMKGEQMSEEKTEEKSVDLEAVAQTERDRIQAVEGLKSDYEGKHPDVIKAVSKEIDNVKFDPKMSLDVAKLKVSNVALNAMEALVNAPSMPGKEAADLAAKVPGAGEKEVKTGPEIKDTNKVDADAVKGIVEGLKNFK